MVVVVVEEEMDGSDSVAVGQVEINSSPAKIAREPSDRWMELLLAASTFSGEKLNAVKPRKILDPEYVATYIIAYRYGYLVKMHK